METIITIEDKELREKVQELLNTKNYIVSQTAPTISSPFPLWIYNGTMKLWIGTRWKNVGEFYDTTNNEFRINERGILRKID